MEVARRRWIGKNSGLEASRKRWIEKTNGLEASRTLRDDLEGLKHYACSVFCGPGDATEPSEVASSRYPGPPKSLVFKYKTKLFGLFQDSSCGWEWPGDEVFLIFLVFQGPGTVSGLRIPVSPASQSLETIARQK